MEADRTITESFSATERELLARHFTNVDGPVFALVNLPETVKGALFARYSRYPGTLRRMFIDEFATDLGDSAAAAPSAVEGKRAAELYERIFLGYGDDSVAQLGGAHIACEWTSNVLTKILQRGRLASYLEQSTRYIAYNAPMPDGGFRYWSHPSLGPEYRLAMDKLFEIYSQAIPRVADWVAERYPPAPDDDRAAHARATKAKALDLLRGLLPAASLSHVGIYASGQAYESLLLHLAASPLPEAQLCGERMLAELQKVIPSFVQRVERPERGGVWIDYLRARREQGVKWAGQLGIENADGGNGASVRLLRVEGDENLLATALLFESTQADESAIATAVAGLDTAARGALIADMVGNRENRRHRPGRGFEALRYRFEIVSDYGAFRDLQRHRMLTCQWQSLTPDLGADVPEEVDAAGVGDDYRTALETSANEYARLVDSGLADMAPYAICLAYRIRYVLDLNAREAMQLIELRSGREGHPSYRAVARAMGEQIAALHPSVAAAMKFVDHETEPRLERMLTELRNSGLQAQSS